MRADRTRRAFIINGRRTRFDSETFTGLTRLRGIECRSRERYAEAFVLRKATLAWGLLAGQAG